MHVCCSLYAFKGFAVYFFFQDGDVCCCVFFLYMVALIACFKRLCWFFFSFRMVTCVVVSFFVFGLNVYWPVGYAFVCVRRYASVFFRCVSAVLLRMF